MKRVCSSESLAEIGHYRNLLEQSGIACAVRNEQLSGALGEIPFLDCLPELWVLHDEDLPAASRVIERQRETVAAAPWLCRTCDQPNEGQFALCWSCGGPDDERT